MRIAVLGTGMVGRAISARLTELGHEVTIGTRDPGETLARTETDQMGNPPFSRWSAENPDVGVATFADAATAAELVVNATNGAATLAALASAGAESLAGKVLLDIAEPLDFSRGFPPRLFVDNDDSLGEQVQRAFPQARVVKALNTLNAQLQVRPELLGAVTSVFMSSDDPEAKEIVRELLTSFGHTDIIDLGDLSTARGTEMMIVVWLRLWGALGTPMFNYRIVR